MVEDMNRLPNMRFLPILCLVVARLLPATEPTDIGSRRQLFVGQDLIAEMKNVRQFLHEPVRREIAIKPEHPWEQEGVSYMVAFKDGDRFCAWYRANSAAFGKAKRQARTAYAESQDGIHWIKPKLGIIEFNGSKENNLVWDGGPGNLAPFRDDNPDCKPEERYKAVARSQDLYALVSPDGLRWKLAAKNPILTEGMFDSHNIAFWDHVAQQYVAYTRGVRREGKLGRGMLSKFRGGVRWVRRAVSKDFVNWTEHLPIKTGDAPREELYTNATIRYDRAPKPGWKFGNGVNDIVFLSSRDGIHFDRTFMEAFIRPGLDPGNWHERSLYMERGILQTSPTELSLFCMQNWRLTTVHIRRYTLRPDGFVSIQAGYQPGILTTKPVRFTGHELRLNFSTSAVGWLKVALLDGSGDPIPGFTLKDCPEIYGDQLDGPVKWMGNIGKLAGRPVTLQFQLSDANLYAFRFAETK